MHCLSAECGLTTRSSGAPTAGRQARSGGTRYIFASPGLASCRCRPLSSNVRAHEEHGYTPVGASNASRAGLLGKAACAYGGFERRYSRPGRDNREVQAHWPCKYRRRAWLALAAVVPVKEAGTDRKHHRRHGSCPDPYSVSVAWHRRCSCLLPHDGVRQRGCSPRRRPVRGLAIASRTRKHTLSCCHANERSVVGRSGSRY
jgi:hypothetical protein